ncbi:M24 family metallopeptidase [Micromonospora sp. NPDC048830]|uniref:M24 family metallopeptidase n=1 Tax=Micromonospora sp. NPDC048830 TaxID=3364257 RepID=UPI0037213A78
MTATGMVLDPPYSDFPTVEYQARVQRAQLLMRQHGIDVLLLNQQENVEYFSGFLTGHWGSKTFATGAVLLHRNADPILVIPDFFVGNATRSSWITNMVMFPECHARPRGFADFVIDGIRKLGSSTGVIGIEMGDNLAGGWNLADYHAVRDGLPAAEFRSAQDVIWGCRAIKSAAEVDRMREIVHMTDQGILRAFDHTHEGTTEIEVASWITRTGAELGADGASFLNIRAGLPRYPCADSLPVDRPVELGDMLLVDVGLQKRLYQTDVAYVAHIGKAPDEHRRFYDAVIRSHEAMLAALRPGVRAKDVYEIGRKVLADFGSGKYIDMMGHGIGMDVHEPPIISPYDERIIEPGMLFAMEPWLYDTSRIGLFCVEEIVHVTEDGLETLSSIPRNELRMVDA